jgi:molybdopterin biosynthesis enzyme
VIQQADEGLTARPLNWQGSFDLQTVALANGFVLFDAPAERQAGQDVPVLLLDR